VRTATLQGERLLVVEDEPLIAMDLQATFERQGARVVLARTVPEALRYRTTRHCRRRTRLSPWLKQRGSHLPGADPA